MVCIETYELPLVAYVYATVLPSHIISFSLPHLLLYLHALVAWSSQELGLFGWPNIKRTLHQAGTVDRFLPFSLSQDYILNDAKPPKSIKLSMFYLEFIPPLELRNLLADFSAV